MNEEIKTLIEMSSEAKMTFSKIKRAINSSSIQHVPILERYIHLYRMRINYFVSNADKDEMVYYFQLFQIIKARFEIKFGTMQLRLDPVIVRN